MYVFNLGQTTGIQLVFDTPLFISFAIGELRGKQVYFDAPQIQIITPSQILNHCLQADLAQISAFQYLCFSESAVLDTTTIPEVQIYSFSKRIIYRFNYQVILKSAVQKAIKVFTNFFTKQETLLFFNSR